MNISERDLVIEECNKRGLTKVKEFLRRNNLSLNESVEDNLLLRNKNIVDTWIDEQEKSPKINLARQANNYALAALIVAIISLLINLPWKEMLTWAKEIIHG